MEAYKKYPSIPLFESNRNILRGTVSVFEKLDGGNCQIAKSIDGRVLPGSRSKVLQGTGVDKVWWFKDLVRWASKKSDLQNLDAGLVMYGEWLAHHNVQYDQQHADKFYLIDVFDKKSNAFVPYGKAKNIIRAAGIEIETVKELKRGKLSVEDIEKLLMEKSDYREGYREGIVIKDYKKQRFVKYLHPEFSEYNRTPGSENLPPVERYITSTRLSKIMNAMVEEGVGLTEIEPVAVALRMVQEVQKDHGITLGFEEISRRIKSML